MASAFEPSGDLLDEFRRTIAERGITHRSGDSYIAPAKVPQSLRQFLGKALPRPPLAIAVDVYGTILASPEGEVGLGADSIDAELAVDSAGKAFPHDMAERLREIVAADHESGRTVGFPWPEVDAPSVFARALDMSLEDGARTCVAWECTMNRCQAMPGASGFILSCTARGLPLGIVSNAQFYTLLFIEEAFGDVLGFDPELVMWSYEGGRAKPDRWMFDELARRLSARGVPADRVLYVGNDARNDCVPASEAGMMTALFCGDARSFKPRLDDPRVAACPPSTVVQSWAELGRLLCI
ncbi:MAG: hypothetical protein CVV51_02380 [Spirochaetae bacterium HGW-Spirochaetae-7]|nr:MAG: hypothetical protein CVV51_02380 [Spirochaetae bacterium HGW-Spirochaetae-7]